MQHTILILNETPPTTNTIWRHAVIGGFLRSYISKAGKEFKLRVSAEARKLDWELSDKDIHMEIELTFPTKRRCDIDNYNKGLLDALEGIIYHNDSQIIFLSITKKYSKNNPRTVIKIIKI